VKIHGKSTSIGIEIQSRRNPVWSGSKTLIHRVNEILSKPLRIDDIAYWTACPEQPGKSPARWTRAGSQSAIL
jgi:hypothetical protein